MDIRGTIQSNRVSMTMYRGSSVTFDSHGYGNTDEELYTKILAHDIAIDGTLNTGYVNVPETLDRFTIGENGVVTMTVVGK